MDFEGVDDGMKLFFCMVHAGVRILQPVTQCSARIAQIRKSMARMQHLANFLIFFLVVLINYVKHNQDPSRKVSVLLAEPIFLRSHRKVISGYENMESVLLEDAESRLD